MILVTTDPGLPGRVDEALARALESLPTAAVARAALANGYCVIARDLTEAIDLSDRYAPEHLEILTRDADQAARKCKHYGAVFIGESAAEVLGDYGAGPNHTLPTGGAARSVGGLSVFDFLRVRTWLRIDDARAAQPIIDDAVTIARVEGLEAHARSAERRLGPRAGLGGGSSA